MEVKMQMKKNPFEESCNLKLMKWVFVLTLISGVLISLYMFTNKLPNHDDLGQLWDAMHRPKTGRWFLRVPAWLSGNLSMPWINGVLGIGYLSMAAAIVVDMLKFRSKFWSGAIGISLVSFPAVAATFTYMNCADAYFFGLLLNVLAVWTIKKYKYGVILGVILITLSLGIYQAYIAFGITLVVIDVLLCSLTNQCEIKLIIRKITKNICAFFLGVLGYLFICNIQGVQMSSYQGIDSMGKLTVSEIVPRVLSAYRGFLSFYFVNIQNSYFAWQPFAFLLFVGLAGIAIIFIFKVSSTPTIHKMIVGLCVAVLPFTSFIVYSLSATNTNVHMVMKYGAVTILFFLAVMMDKATYYVQMVTKLQHEKNSVDISNKLNPLTVGKGCLIVAGFIFVTFIYRYILLTNAVYLRLDISLRQAYSDGITLVTKIEMLDSYNVSDTVYLVGIPNISYAARDSKWIMDDTFDAFSMGNQTRLFANQRFLHRYVGYDGEIIDRIRTVEDIDKLGIANIVKDMPIYPNSGAIVRIDNGNIYVKFSEIV